LFLLELQHVRTTGQALVEFAIAVSLFLLLVLGTFDVARAYLAYTVTTNAVREVARYGAAHVQQADWQSAALQAGHNLAIGVDPSELQLAPPTQQTTPTGLTYISASGNYSFHSVTPLVGALLGNPINMQVTTAVLAG
jgi:Flp pilus assembly protein TadG